MLQETNNNTPQVSYELGSVFTWANPDDGKQRGWELDKEIRSRIVEGAFKYYVIVLDANTVKKNGGLGGIEIIFNSKNNGFCIDYNSFPWNWDSETEKGGYISYNELLSEKHATINSGLLYIKYDISSHPNYKGFKTEMASADWGQLSIQYGIGIRILPFVNAYLQG